MALFLKLTNVDDAEEIVNADRITRMRQCQGYTAIYFDESSLHLKSLPSTSSAHCLPGVFPVSDRAVRWRQSAGTCGPHLRDSPAGFLESWQDYPQRAKVRATFARFNRTQSPCAVPSARRYDRADLGRQIG